MTLSGLFVSVVIDNELPTVSVMWIVIPIAIVCFTNKYVMVR
jgi:hypothetical protein